MLVYVTSDVELEIKQSQLKCNSFCEKGFFYDYLGVFIPENTGSPFHPERLY